MPTSKRDAGARSLWCLLQLGVFCLVAGLAPRALAQLDAGAPACTGDDACPADQYCASATGACSPRCDDAGLCVGPPVSASTPNLATDGARVCYLAPVPGEGDAALGVWSWDASARPPRLIARAAEAHALLIADGFCYVAGSTLTRASLRRGCVEQTVYEGEAAPKRMWLGEQHVWWTVPGEAGLEIWRSPRRARVPAPERVAVGAAEQDWEASDGEQLYRRVRGSRACSIVSAPFEDLGDESSTLMTYSWSCGGELHADGEGLLYNQYSSSSYQLYRIDAEDPSAQIFTGMTSSDYAPVRYVVDGDWLYAQRVENPVGIRYPVTFYRTRRREAVRELVYAAPPGLVNFRATLFAVLGDSLVFVSYREPRLAVQRIAPPP